jgi:hypothetical protein
LVARRAAGFSENIKSSEGSGGSGFCVATSSMSSLTAVDSVFFSAIAPRRIDDGAYVFK